MGRLRVDSRLADIGRGEGSLRSGSRGEGVRAIQEALVRLGFDVGEAGADGIFGRDTEAAIRRFQQANGRSSSGEVDRETLLLLDTALDAAPAADVPSGLPEDYILKPIADLRVLDARTDPAASGHDIRTVHPPEVGADIVVSGTFHSGGDPVGPLVQRGRWVTPGGWPHGRGGVAVLGDGTMRIGFYADPREATVRAAFEQPGNTIREFMGGGALIVENGAAVSSTDLENRQLFRGGAAAPQFEASARHTLVGVHADGKAYLIIDAGQKPLGVMQRDFMNAGFRDVIMFDGGNAFGYEDAQDTLFGRVPGRKRPELSNDEVAALRGQHDVALTGFAIKTR